MQCIPNTPRPTRIATLAILCLALGIAAGMAYWLFHGLHFYAISADEASRVLLADRWRRAPRLIVHAWPPLPQILIGIGLWLHLDMFLTPRLVTMLAGLAAVPALGWLAHELFRDRPTSMLTMLLAAVFPQRVLLSSVPLAEIYTGLFVVIGCAGLARYLRMGGIGWLAAAGLGFALGGACRYEAWIFAAGAGFLLVYLRLRHEPGVRIGHLTVFAAVVSIFPLWWMYAWKREFGGYLRFLTIVKSEYEFLFGVNALELFTRSASWQFLTENIQSLNIVGLLGLWCAARESSLVRRLLFPPALAFLLMSISSALGALPSHNFWRLSWPWTYMLIPFTARVPLMVTTWLSSRPRLSSRFAMGAGVCITGGLFLAFAMQALQRGHESTMDEQQRDAAAFLARMLDDPTNAQCNVLIDSSNWSYIHIRVASGHPDQFVQMGGFDARRQGKSLLTGNVVQDLAFLRDRRIGWIAARTPELKKQLEQYPDLQVSAEFADWRMYRFAPRPPA